MLHYFVNKPDAGETLFYVEGEYRITPNLKPKTRVFFYADTKSDAIELAKAWKTSNIFIGDLRTMCSAERLCNSAPLNSPEFFAALRALAFQTKNEPEPCE
jgi:hypothetical protein